MSKLYWTAYIDSIKNNKCTEAEQQILQHIFERQMKRTATTLARKTWFALEDFNLSVYADPAKETVQKFNFLIERRTVEQQDQWLGIFTHEDKKLEIIGTLEPD